MNNRKFILGIVSLLGLGSLSTAATADDSAATPEFFKKHIEPVLVARCYECHGESPGEGGLTLSWRTGLVTGGDNGTALISGKPEDSLLIKAIRYESDLQMPPDGKLSKEEIANFVRWVEAGAVWPDEQPPSADPAGPTQYEPTEEQRNLWSLQPVRAVKPPEVRGSGWVQSPIDRFILNALESRNLAPAAMADQRTLIRRVTFDLTGLPPTPEEVDAFLADNSKQAFARVVDRLLASPQYGERWGRHWLDLVRYADSRDLIQLGAALDFREAWRYRDWVVGAFNQDLPYDQFVKLQIAGDLMQPKDPDQIDVDALVATGMLALADFVPGEVDRNRLVADYVNDQIDVIGRGFMGLTVACARCHDHKFDPISTQDYYALAGIFFSTSISPAGAARATLLPPPVQRAMESDKQRLNELTRCVAELTHKGQVALAREYRQSRMELVAKLTPRYLHAALEYRQSVAQDPTVRLDQWITSTGLDEAMLRSWLHYLEKHPHAALSSLLVEKEPNVRQQQVQQLSQQLQQVVARRNPANIEDPIARTLIDTELLRFSADDSQIQTNSDGRVVTWRDHAGVPESATPRTALGPTLATATIQGKNRRVIRFTGQEVLQVPRTVPSQGSLFVVYRSAPGPAAGRRLLGWEDATIGEHGLGLIADANNAVSAVLRREGALGDVNTILSSEFQLISITWGQQGVVMHSSGKEAARNATINEVSPAPNITALSIGGAGAANDALNFIGDLAELRVYASQLDETARAAVEKDLQGRWFGSEESEPWGLDPIEDLYEELLSPRGPFLADQYERDRPFPTEFREQLAAMRQEIAPLKTRTSREVPQAVVAIEGGPGEHPGCQDAAVYIRGNPANKGPIVPRAFPRALAGDNQPPITKGSGRLELAAWLTNPHHPLTARVMVNRIWHHHFGEGLVRTTCNLGTLGDRPAHPELLDFLAGQFVKAGWSIKAMHRLILLSSVYQQSCHTSPAVLAADPENRLLGRMNRRRLEAEAVRDNLLAVAGRLDRTMGGPATADTASTRRGLYLMSARTGAATSFFTQLFDGANCAGIVEERGNSVVAPQALFMLNDPQVTELAKALAMRVAEESNSVDPAVRLERLYQIAVGRLPSETEIQIGREFLGEQPTEAAWARYSQILLCTNEFIYVD